MFSSRNATISSTRAVLITMATTRARKASNLTIDTKRISFVKKKDVLLVIKKKNIITIRFY